LRDDYDIYLVSDKPELANAFLDAMKSCCATWLWHDVPQPYKETPAIFLPCTEALSMRVSLAIRNAGFVELGQHFDDVARSNMPAVIERHLHS